MAAALTLLLALAGCVLQLRNQEPARQLARETWPEPPASSLYLGWRVFQDRCARCHGAAAEGGTPGPNLLARMGELGPRRFAAFVLQRYDWDDASARAREDGPAREAVIDEVMQRRTRALDMPAWQGEPRVQAHIQDLYEYLAARAAGTLPAGPPPR
jgi:mono/diheme cytochrome c family protein